MKKLIALVLVAMMLIPAVVYACEQAAILPNIETNTWDVTGAAWVARSEENMLLFGKLTPDEILEIYPARSAGGTFVRGIRQDGIIREKGEMRYLIIEGAVCGLTKTEVTVEISAEDWESVKRVVIRRMGKTEDDEITAAAILACTLGRTETTVYHYLFGRTANYIIVGTVIFNGQNAAPLCVGDWNGDGLADVGFPVYLGNPQEETPEPAATPEPVVIRDTVYVKETVVVREKPCVKIVQNNFQVNINSTVTNCQRVIIGGGCKGGCKVQCLEN